MRQLTSGTILCPPAEGRDPVDRDLEQRVANFLAQRQMPALRRVSVEARGGRVTLRGRVASFYEKQLALSCCQRVAGVLSLNDEVDVAHREACTTRA